MDPFAASAANILVGNSIDEAVLEITLLGPQLKFLTDTIVALTGADLSARIGGREMAPWSSVSAEAGQVLSFGSRQSGARVYLAIGGGIDVSRVMGSRSTDLKSRIGGYFGRHLKSGDQLSVNHRQSAAPGSFGGRSLRLSDLERFRPKRGSIRFIRSANDDPFLSQTITKFTNRSFKLLSASDRMGFRFGGPNLTPDPVETSESWSEPVAAGTIQLPPAGLPIVLMADRQTVGGYPKLGTVISVDIGRLAQAAPGDRVRFAEIDVHTAQALLRAEQQFLQLIALANT
jgi:antagonist of KipI